MSTHTDIIHMVWCSTKSIFKCIFKMTFCCLCHALHYTSSPLHSLSYYITSFNSNHMYDRLIMYLMSSATLSLTLSLSTSSLVSVFPSLLCVSGAESEKSPWPSKTCFALQWTSPTGWRSHRSLCMLHSPSS